VTASTRSGLRERGRGGLLCLALLCVLWALGPTPAYAADSEQQERIERWNNLEPEEREELRRRYRKLQQASPGERRELRRRLEGFRSLSPEKQQQMRRNHQRWSEFSPERPVAGRTRPPEGTDRQAAGRAGQRPTRSRATRAPLSS
jgi:hypothetical protein